MNYLDENSLLEKFKMESAIFDSNHPKFSETFNECFSKEWIRSTVKSIISTEIVSKFDSDDATELSQGLVEDIYFLNEKDIIYNYASSLSGLLYKTLKKDENALADPEDMYALAKKVLLKIFIRSTNKTVDKMSIILKSIVSSFEEKGGCNSNCCGKCCKNCKH